ncbi:CotH kinase family protein [Sorangium sp. So ce131]|uniref:CotH kinase family protein n=1 Tax=Sorangium sp. So ce131 TaxID=3133282 RepID=UPI003F611650
MKCEPWILIALSAAALVAGCAEDAEPTPAAQPSSSCEPPDSALAERDADELFAANEVLRFDFNLPEERWSALKESASDEEYVESEICYQGKSLGVSGLRFKGGSGALDECVEQGEEITCPKLSMKVKFDEYVDGQRFYDLRRLNFHSMTRDDTKLRERLAYDLYREMGVAAPRSAWATLYVNGETLGLYAVVEEIDGRFVDHHFPDAQDGPLYKEAWPISTETSYYAERVDANEEEATHAGFVAFAEALAASEGQARLAALLQWTDVAELARYMAVDDAIMNFDGVTSFYVDKDGSASNHNYFFYEEPSSGTFRLIPWDLDNTLNLAAFENYGEVPHWTEAPADCSAELPVYMGDEAVRAPGCDPLFNALSHDAEGYQAALDELLAGPFSEARLQAEVKRYADLIRAAVAADPYGPTAEAWERAVERLEGDIPLMRARLER